MIALIQAPNSSLAWFGHPFFRYPCPSSCFYSTGLFSPPLCSGFGGGALPVPPSLRLALRAHFHRVRPDVWQEGDAEGVVADVL